MLYCVSDEVLSFLEHQGKHDMLHQGLDYIVYLRYCIDFDLIKVYLKIEACVTVFSLCHWILKK